MSLFFERIEALGDLIWWFLTLVVLISFPLSWLGVFLGLRKQVFMGDAMSHSILPGIVIGFLFIGNLDSIWLQIGAVVAAVIAAFLVELIQENNRIKQDAAIGITFSTLFSIGVFLLSWVDHVDLDPGCIIHGQIEFFVGKFIDFEGILPAVILKQAVITSVIMGLIGLVYYSLVSSAFDVGHAKALGLPTKWVRYGLLVLLALALVSSFNVVGAVLPIALLVLPNATVSMWSNHLKMRLIGALVVCLFTSLLAVVATLMFDLNMAGTLVSVHFLFFIISLVLGKSDGLLHKRMFKSSHG